MIHIASHSLVTTIQDLGRVGYQKYGINVSGAMDPLSLRAANLLVGNEEGAGAIEMTLIGPDMTFEEDTLLALTGADLSPNIKGIPVPMYRPVAVKAGTVLSFGRPRLGVRGYMAVAGGFDVPSSWEARAPMPAPASAATWAAPSGRGTPCPPASFRKR